MPDQTKVDDLRAGDLILLEDGTVFLISSDVDTKYSNEDWRLVKWFQISGDRMGPCNWTTRYDSSVREWCLETWFSEVTDIYRGPGHDCR